GFDRKRRFDDDDRQSSRFSDRNRNENAEMPENPLALRRNVKALDHIGERRPSLPPTAGTTGMRSRKKRDNNNDQ
ncbi:MAG: hypothetical protein K2K37_03685, partial [Muribaculaceae bacterium]|nr:hypothetical protein [Muribaculaceae bacterium]